MAADGQNDTVTCTIDGTEITVAKGTRIIEAAEQAGIGIAHYCYHPALSAPAMCRMCLVEVEGAPKLVPACVTAVMDGQVIRTQAEKAREARTGVLEFYLANHPLDCPICDASGECKLQDYVALEGRSHGRIPGSKRVLGQDDFGAGITYDGDRCIMCTRCVRFMREVAGDDRLCVVQRGHRSVIDTFFDEGLDGSLFAGNIVDICPVGALLSRDFLHKARAWDLDRTPSICPNCSQGCNITLDTRDNLVVRIKPRPNPDVNSYWLCDYGRYRYEWINGGAAEVAGAGHRGGGDGGAGEPRGAGAGPRGGALLAGGEQRVGAPMGGHGGAPAAGGSGAGRRLEAPLVRGDEGVLAPATWQQAATALVERLGALRGSGKVRALASPMHANEEAGLLARLVEVLGGGEALFRCARAEDEVVCPGFPRLARRRDLAANARGLEVLGYRRIGDDAGRGGIDAADVAGAVLLVLGDALADQPPDFGAAAALFVYLGETPAPAAVNAHFVLPITTFAEQEGTFTNHEGRVQRFWPAIRPPVLARPAWQVLGVLLAGLDDAPAPASAADAFLRLAELYEPFGGLTYERLGSRGALLGEPVQLATATGGAE